jgi:GntR family transcriptional regulator/MocR family aminotransferase
LDAIFYLDPESPESLQTQLRQSIINAILIGSLEPGSRLPSSRRLAESLGVARNTVSLAVQQLISDGYLVGRERSGVFIGDALLDVVRPGEARGERAVAGPLASRAKTKSLAPVEVETRAPPSWDLNPFPFLDGYYDASLTPRAEWRDAVRASMTFNELMDWSMDAGETDDPRLVHELRTKALPRRGVVARPEEVLVTTGARDALALICRTFVGRGARVAIEEPGLPDLRRLLRLEGAQLVLQPVDGEGLVVDARLDEAKLVFVTPGRQFPTGARLSQARRAALLETARDRDQLVVEYDLPASGGFADHAAPALYSMDARGRVIYAADLCEILTPGLRIGVIVAEAELIRELRKVRTITSGPAPRAAQRMASFFLSLGHYDAMLTRQHRVLRERLSALRDALNYRLPHLVAIDPHANGTAMWVEGPPELGARQLANEAAKRGVLIEPSDRFFAGSSKAANCFRMGVTGVPAERIPEGVGILAEVLRSLDEPFVDRLDLKAPSWLSGDELWACMSGSKLLCRTAYGDPYEVDVREDGALVGRAGYAHEDCDTGRWWVEGDYWCRQWSSWAYGETARFLTVIEGAEIKWYRSDLVLFNRGVITALEERLAAEV